MAVSRTTPWWELTADVGRLRRALSGALEQLNEIEVNLGEAMYGYEKVDGKLLPAWGDATAVTLSARAARILSGRRIDLLGLNRRGVDEIVALRQKVTELERQLELKAIS